MRERGKEGEKGKESKTQREEVMIENEPETDTDRKDASVRESLREE